LNDYFSIGYIKFKILFKMEEYMDRDKLNHFWNRLLEEKKNLIKSRENITQEEFGSMDLYYTESSNYDNHPGDIGTELFFKEQDQGFRNKMDDTLDDIDHALEKIKNKSYGICEKCHKNIDEERLEVVPYAKTCLECSEEVSPKLDNRLYESIDEKIATSSSVDPDSNVEYDREDAYQEVSYYNIVPNDPSFTTGDNMGLVIDEADDDSVEAVENFSQEYYDETLK
jgi:YteA family regulatory protein